MLYVDVRSLSQHGIAVKGELMPNDPVWGDADVIPATALQVEGRVSSAGSGKFYFSGHVRGKSEQQCPRCLEPVAAEIVEEVRALFSEPGSDVEDDPDVFSLDPANGTIDLKPAVRELWLLNVPRFVLCSDDCKGLCPTCGENLNEITCNCPPTHDSRWDALRGAQHN